MIYYNMTNNRVDLKELETKILSANLKKNHYLYNKTIDKLYQYLSQIDHERDIENNLVELLEQIDQVKENILNHKSYVDITNFDNEEIHDLKDIIEQIYQACSEFNIRIKKIELDVNNIFTNNKEKLKLSFQEIIELIKELKIEIDKINGIELQIIDENDEQETTDERPKGYYLRLKNWIYSYWK